MLKCKCGETISFNRQALGYKNCMQCGQKAAEVEIAAKSQRIGVAYNKGGLIYLGAPDVASKNLRDTMGAQGRSVATLADGERIQGSVPLLGTVTGRFPCSNPNESNPPKRGFGPLEVIRHRRSIGVMYIRGEAVAIFNRDDPRIKTASRTVFFTAEALRGNTNAVSSGATKPKVRS